MRISYKLISAVTAVTLSASCKPFDFSSQDEVSQVKIVNGTEVSPSDPLYSSVVTLGMCTGSVLSPTLILTAGHCVASKSGRPRSGVVVKFKGKSYEASKIIVHPEYNIRYRLQPNDIAIISLNTPLEDAFPIRLDPGVKYTEGDEVILAGFGVSEKNQYVALDAVEKRFVSKFSQSKELSATERWKEYEAIKAAMKDSYTDYAKVSRGFSYNTSTQEDVERVRTSYDVYQSKKSELEVLLINAGYAELENDQTYQDLLDYFRNRDGAASFGVLRETTTNISEIAPTLILFESQNGLNSSCKGDSGGPMFRKTDNGLVQIGVTHAVNYSVPGSMGQCLAGGAYTRLSAYTDFIKSNMN